MEREGTPLPYNPNPQIPMANCQSQEESVLPLSRHSHLSRTRKASPKQLAPPFLSTLSLAWTKQSVPWGCFWDLPWVLGGRSETRERQAECERHFNQTGKVLATSGHL